MNIARTGFPRPETIVLIHGLWMTPLSWEHWIERYTTRGFQVMAPSWPRMEGSVEQLRQNPARLAGLGAAEIIDHYDRLMRALDEPPIVMGHSFGGAFVQVLLDRGLGAAGVAIDPAPMPGLIRLPVSTLRVSFPALRNPLNARRAVSLTYPQFRYAFTNTLNEAESMAAYERYPVPGPDRVLFDGALANLRPDSPLRVDYRNGERAPLLLVAGGRDHVAPASLTRRNAHLYRKSKAHTDYVEFPERSHFTLGQPGWEEVADYALDWALDHQARPAPSPSPAARP